MLRGEPFSVEGVRRRQVWNHPQFDDYLIHHLFTLQIVHPVLWFLRWFTSRPTFAVAAFGCQLF